jgi:hypothetical protein
MTDLVKNYAVAVEHPEVSGFEHLDMLMLRDRIEDQLTQLSTNQIAQLALADRTLLAHAGAFQRELSHITDLEYERQRRRPPLSHWWWYLDVLAYLPDGAMNGQELIKQG